MMNKKIFSVISIFLFSVCLFAQSKKDGYVLQGKNVIVEYVPYNGGVIYYYTDPNDKAYSKAAVIDTVDYANSTFIAVSIDKKTYNLHNSSGITYSYTNDGKTLTVIYQIKKLIELSVHYTVSNKNVLTVSYSVKNIDSKNHTVMLKSIFDTVLEEFNGGFYSTDAKKKLKSEYIISDFEKHGFVDSSNGVLSVRFLLDENFSKYAYKVVIAAKPYFESDIFEGRFVEGRGFNTVLSYNNSAIGFFFKTLKLNPGDEKTFVQKMLFAKTEFVVPEEFDDDSDKNLYDEGENKTSTVVNDFVPADNAEDFKPSVIETEPETETVENAVENPAVDISEDSVTVQKPSKPKVNKKEIQKIIDRINEIEDDGSNTSREEVIQLQIELDRLLNQVK